MTRESAAASVGRLSGPARYALTLSAVAVAMLLARGLRSAVDAEPVFFAAVILTSWFAGMAEGLVAVALSVLALRYDSGAANAGYLIVFMASALLVSRLAAKRRRAETSLQQARDQLEARVQERTADLERANAEAQEELAERKRVEAALREKADLLDLTYDAVMVRDGDDVIVYWNRAAEELFGYRGEEALGKVSHQLLKSVFPLTWDDLQAELVERGRWEGEVTHTRRDGREIVVDARWAVRKGGEGKLLAILAINTDVTERNRAKEALRQMQSELARISRVQTLGELTASIAHEVNQPLSAVVTNGHACMRWLASEAPNLEEAREAARRIIRDANRASEVVTRTRALFKKTESRRERLDLNQVIQDIIALTQDELVNVRVALRTELSGLPPVDADRVQLEQVVLNLIVNAVEAMRATEGARQLTIKTESQGSNGVAVAVVDTGIGLDAEQLDHVFDAYFTTKPNGMGLGLPISRSLVEAHGGRLWAEANAGPGATFRFTLPAAGDPFQDAG